MAGERDYITGSELPLISRQVFGPPNNVALRPFQISPRAAEPPIPLLSSPADYKWVQVGWEHCSWTGKLRCLICTPASFLSEAQIGSIFKKLQWAGCRDRTKRRLLFQPVWQHSVKISCNVTKWEWSSDGLQTERRGGKWSILWLFSFYHFQNIPSSIVALRYIWTPGEKRIGPEGNNEDQISFLQKGAPLFSLQNTWRRFICHPSPLSWVLLYVNSMYLRRLEGNTASAGDSEMLHFSPLTKGKGPGWLQESPD